MSNEKGNKTIFGRQKENIRLSNTGNELMCSGSVLHIFSTNATLKPRRVKIKVTYNLVRMNHNQILG